MKRTLLYISSLLIIIVTALWAHNQATEWKLTNKIDTIREPGQAKVAVRDGFAYYIARKTMLILDVSDPANVRRVSVSSYDADLEDIALYKDFAVLSSQDKGLLVVDVRAPEEPTLVGTYSETGDVRFLEILIKDDLAYVADYTARTSRDYTIIILDLTDPLQIKKVSAIRPGGHPLAVYGNYLYVKGDYTDGHPVIVDRLSIIDISDNRKPKLVFQSDGFGDVLDAGIQDHYLYIATPEGVVIADVSNPANPVEVGRIKVLAWRLLVQDDFLYYMGFEKVGMVNITDRSRPKAFAASHQVSFATDIAYSMGYVYFAGANENLLYIFEGGER